MHPQALHFLQLVYGLDHTLDGLNQDEAMAIAHGLTEMHVPRQSEKARIRHTVGAFMIGHTPDAIAQQIVNGDDAMSWHMYENGAEVEKTLTDLAARWRSYNEASTLWHEEEVRQDPLGGSDRDLLDKVRDRALEDMWVHTGSRTFSFEEVVLGAVTHLAPREQLNQTLQDRIDRKAEAADLAIELYSRTPEFQKAFERKGHEQETEIFVIGPDDDDEQSEVQRQAAWLLHRGVFLDKDGTPMESMRSIEDRRQDYHFVAVHHTSSGPVPLGSMYLKARTAEDPTSELPSLQALAKSWGQSLPKLLAESGREYLLNSPHIMDIVTVGVRKQHKNSLANPGMYNALGKLADKLGITDFVTIFDEAPARMLNRYYEAFKRYAPESVIPPKTYDAPRGEGANWSLPLHCNIAEWKANLTPAKLAVYFGDRLASRIKITNVYKGRLPIEVAPNEPLGINQLLKRHDRDRILYGEGPVLYIDKGVTTSRFVGLKTAFPENTAVHYAMKSNPTPEILHHLHSLGCKFEIASFAELQELRHALRGWGASEVEFNRVAAETLFSNPVKSRLDIQQAYAAGVRRFSFQGVNELHKIAQCAPGAEVYLRLTTPSGRSTVASESKFGMTVRTPEQQKEAADLLLQARSLGLTAYGLAFHVGSQMENPNAWDLPLHNGGEVMRLLADQGVKLQMLDIGGGFPAYHNAGIPSINAYGKALRAGFEQLPYQPVTFAIEPGRGFSDAGAMVTTVIGTEIRGEGNQRRKWVYLNAGAFNGFMEALETDRKLQFPITDELQSDRITSCVITGPSCDGQDTITDSQFLSADLSEGDRVVFYTAGAYTSAYASRFNGFEVPVVQVL